MTQSPQDQRMQLYRERNNVMNSLAEAYAHYKPREVCEELEGKLEAVKIKLKALETQVEGQII